MPMTLEEFNQGMGHHLRMISTCAQQIKTHAEAMMMRPDFESMAEDDLARCEVVLAQALGRVRHAALSIKEKPVDG